MLSLSILIICCNFFLNRHIRDEFFFDSQGQLRSEIEYSSSFPLTIVFLAILLYELFVDLLHLVFCYRKGAYTCWAQSTGAEEFNYGSRIDHILSAGSCLHGEEIQKGHAFVACHVAECDILMQFQRWKPGNTPR